MSDSEVDTVLDMYERKQKRNIRKNRADIAHGKTTGLALAKVNHLQQDSPPIVVGVCSNIHNVSTYDLEHG